jgi:hypothetical protein
VDVTRDSEVWAKFAEQHKRNFQFSIGFGYLRQNEIVVPFD